MKLGQTGGPRTPSIQRKKRRSGYGAIRPDLKELLDHGTPEPEAKQDKRGMRWGVAIAILAHLIFFAVTIPKVIKKTAPKPPKKVYVVKQVRFKPPPPKQQQEIPRPKAKKVPIPDPTPDEPEPIRLPEEIEPQVEMPDTDIIFGIPEGPPPDEPSGPIRVGGDVKPPEKLPGWRKPQYNEIARKARIQGVVIVECIVDKNGDVVNVKVLKGLPMGLDQAAVDAVSTWKFRPGTLNGKPVAVIYNLTVNFQLR